MSPLCHILACVGLTTVTAFSQDPTFRRADNTFPNVPELSLDTPLPPPGNTTLRSGESSGPLSAYGEQEILVRNTPLKLFSVTASASYTSQTNAAVSPNVNEEDEVFNQSLSIGALVPFSTFASPSWLQSTYLSLNIREQVLRYRELDFLDLDRVESSASILQALHGGFIASVGARYYRLSVPNDFNAEVFSNFSVTTALLGNFQTSRNSSLFVSVSADVSLSASSEIAQRNDYAAIGAYTLRLAPHWELTASAGATLLDFADHDDVNYNATVGLHYVPRSWFRIGASIAYTRSESNLDTFDYQNFSYGPLVRASLRF